MIMEQELSLMVLDLFEHTGELSDLHRYVSIPIAVVEGFRQRFPKVNATTGKTIMFPAQAGHLSESVQTLSYLSSVTTIRLTSERWEPIAACLWYAGPGDISVQGSYLAHELPIKPCH